MALAALILLAEVSCFKYPARNQTVADECPFLVVSGSPMANLYPGEIAGANLGMKVEIWNSEGRNIEDTGEKGDLVITKPFSVCPLDSGEKAAKPNTARHILSSMLVCGTMAISSAKTRPLAVMRFLVEAMAY